MSFEEGYMDVLIIGGGPVGLLTAYALQKMGVSTSVIGECIKFSCLFWSAVTKPVIRTT
jgi:ribulose 1,5-bisphosphate synthetase/thiazole synthase